jgi:hypothetical protein
MTAHDNKITVTRVVAFSVDAAFDLVCDLFPAMPATRLLEDCESAAADLNMSL